MFLWVLAFDVAARTGVGLAAEERQLGERFRGERPFRLEEPRFCDADDLFGEERFERDAFVGFVDAGDCEFDAAGEPSSSAP